MILPRVLGRVLFPPSPAYLTSFQLEWSATEPGFFSVQRFFQEPFHQAPTPPMHMYKEKLGKHCLVFWQPILSQMKVHSCDRRRSDSKETRGNKRAWCYDEQKRKLAYGVTNTWKLIREGQTILFDQGHDSGGQQAKWSAWNIEAAIYTSANY